MLQVHPVEQYIDFEVNERKSSQAVNNFKVAMLSLSLRHIEKKNFSEVCSPYLCCKDACSCSIVEKKTHTVTHTQK